MQIQMSVQLIPPMILSTFDLRWSTHHEISQEKYFPLSLK